ncbi:hypothetical protein J6590_024824 [Homalodisca vitripennis]|nr:hypothetical protein J6590_024824 [Homalodisca vitripennis]
MLGLLDNKEKERKKERKKHFFIEAKLGPHVTIQRVAPPPATIIRSRYFRLSSATNRFRLSICLTGSGKEFHNLHAVTVKDRL